MITLTPRPKEATNLGALLRASVPARLWQLEPSPFVLPAALAPYRPTRREFLVGAGSLLLLGAAGCGNGGESGDEGASGKGRTIEHKYGTTEINGVPERVVTVGLTDHDAVLALGVTPVAVREWIDERAIWPWAQDRLGVAEPEVLDLTDLNFEQIANLQPDLILGLYSELTEDEYDTLSEIAPTVAQPKEYVDYGVPWQEQTRTIGHALGREEQAEELVADLEARFAEVREEHPEFQSATGIVAYSFEPGSYGVYGPEDSRGRFLTSLSFELPDEIAELAGDEYFAEISRERLDLVDADVLVWIIAVEGAREAVEEDPLYRQLDVAREGRDIFPSETQQAALSFSTVLSLPFALDELVPQLAAAVDGDPETEVRSAS